MVVAEVRRLHHCSRHRIADLGGRGLAESSPTPVRTRPLRNRSSRRLLGAGQLPSSSRRCLSRARIDRRAASSPSRFRGAPLSSGRPSGWMGIRAPESQIQDRRIRFHAHRVSAFAGQERGLATIDCHLKDFGGIRIFWPRRPIGAWVFCIRAHIGMKARLDHGTRLLRARTQRLVRSRATGEVENNAARLRARPGGGALRFDVSFNEGAG